MYSRADPRNDVCPILSQGFLVSQAREAPRGPAMSLSAWEQRRLDSIKDELAGSDSELTRLLAAFNLLTSDQKMPAREKIWVSPRLAHHRRRSPRSLPRSQRVVLALWLLTTVTLVGVVLTLTLGNSTPNTCADTVAVLCGGPAAGHSATPPAHSADTGRSSQQAVSIPQAGP